MSFWMGKDVKKNARLSFRVPAELKKTLRVIAAASDKNVSELAETFIKDGVNRFLEKHPSIRSLLDKVL